MEDRSAEIRRLQSCFNDLVSVLAVPAIPKGQDSSQIVITLLEALVGMLRLDFAYARLPDWVDAEPMEVVRLAPRARDFDAHEVGRCLSASLDGPKPKPHAVVPNPIADGNVSVATFRLGLEDDVGLIIFASQRSDFPTKIEMLLLRVAANQAVICLQESRRSGEQKRAATELEHRVAERTKQLQSVNEELRLKVDELSRTNSDIENLMASTDIATIFLDRNLRIKRFTPQIQRLFNITSADVDRPLRDLPHRLNYTGFLKDVRRVLDDSAVVEREVRTIDDDWYILRILPYRTHHNTIGGVVVTFVKITERRRAEEKALEANERVNQNHMYPAHDGGLVTFQRYVTDRKLAEEKLRRNESYLVEGQRISHTGSWAWNVSSGDLFWSREHFRICGLDPEQPPPSAEAFLEMVHPEDRSFLEQTFQSALRTETDFECKYRIIRPTKVIRYIHSIGKPAFDETGKLTEYVGTIVDVTERKLAEEALRHAHVELAHATRANTMGELTASIAHEVNQPLGAIVTNGNACLHLLSRDKPDLAGAREAVECMVSDSMRASEVIKRIRRLLKKSSPETAPLNMNETIRDVIALAGNELERTQVSLRTELDSDLPPALGDRVQLQQVVLNLILNSNDAMSKPGWHPRDLLIKSQKSKANEVLVTVEDSGPGLQQNAERLFEAFFSTKEGGLGLGLSISRTIIEAHGGRLWHAPREGNGAKFHFTIPATG